MKRMFATFVALALAISNGVAATSPDVNARAQFSKRQGKSIKRRGFTRHIVVRGRGARIGAGDENSGV